MREQEAGVDERYGACIPVQPTDATNDIDTEIQIMVATATLDDEYQALVAEALVSA